MKRITRDLQRQIHKQLHDVECITSQLAAGDLVNPDRLETEELRLATLLACLEALVVAVVALVVAAVVALVVALCRRSK